MRLHVHHHLHSSKTRLSFHRRKGSHSAVSLMTAGEEDDALVELVLGLVREEAAVKIQALARGRKERKKRKARGALPDTSVSTGDGVSLGSSKGCVQVSVPSSLRNESHGGGAVSELAQLRHEMLAAVTKVEQGAQQR